MRQHISALMDGELFDDEVETLLERLKRETAGQEEWLLYHLIGDSLRQPDHVHADISSTLRQRLQDEPTVLAPRHKAGQNARWFAVSAAASVLALAVVAWLSAQVPPEAAPRVALQQAVENVHPAKLASKRSMNDYLMAHQEFSPAANVQGATAYIRTVAEQQ